MKRQTNNKGFSLVELLVVISIMAVALAMISVSVAVVFSNSVRSAANSVDSMLSKAKVNSNYRAPMVFIEIDRDADGRIVGRYYEGYEVEKFGDDYNGVGAATPTGAVEVLGKSNIAVSASSEFSSSSLPIIIGFERNTGRMFEGTPASGGGYNFKPFSLPTGTTEARIILGSSGSLYEIVLTPFTGKHEVRRG